MTYSEWTADFAKRNNGVLLGACKRAVEEMCATFPELTKVAGHVFCLWGRRGHFWATTPDGQIVDPTRAQFPGPVEYEPWKPGETVRVGKCMSCGEEIWRPVQSLENVQQECVCSEECERDLADYYAPGGRGDLSAKQI